MLFRIEAAVLLGVTHPTCTMQLAKWNIPSKKYNFIITNNKLKIEKIDRLAVRNNIYKQMKTVAPNCCLVMKPKPVRSKIDNNVPTLTEFANLYKISFKCLSHLNHLKTK